MVQNCRVGDVCPCLCSAEAVKKTQKVAIPMILWTYPNGGGRLIHDKSLVSGSWETMEKACMANDYKEPNKVAIPVLTPDRMNKRQNGRRMKENGDDEFTLTAQDLHEVGVDEHREEIATIYYPKENCNIAIRKLTPKEYFRLQGWTDDYFEKAQFINSNSQLYKQAGNGVTVNVIEAISKKLNYPKKSDSSNEEKETV